MDLLRFLIWDVGGTLFDTYPATVRAFARGLEDLGASAPDEYIAALVRVSRAHCAAVLAQEHALDSDELYRRFEQRYAQIPPEEQVLFPGAVDVCTFALERGGNNYLWTHRERASVHALLGAHAMERYFAGIVAADDGFPRKPDPAGLMAIILRHQLPRDETLVIGDREIDLLGGRNAGVHTACFGPAPGGIVVDYRFHAYAQLLAWLQAGRRDR